MNVHYAEGVHVHLSVTTSSEPLSQYIPPPSSPKKKELEGCRCNGLGATSQDKFCQCSWEFAQQKAFIGCICIERLGVNKICFAQEGWTGTMAFCHKMRRNLQTKDNAGRHRGNLHPPWKTTTQTPVHSCTGTTFISTCKRCFPWSRYSVLACWKKKINS